MGKGAARDDDTDFHMELEGEEEEADFSNFIKVSHRDDVHRLAGKLAWNARRDEHMPMLASGPGAINNAVEAIAEARKYLGQDDDAKELFCQPAFRDRNMGSSLAFYMTSSDTRQDVDDESAPQFTASKASKPAIVAGAIAARVREGIGPVVTAIGEDAVTNAVLAACRARIYLEDNNRDIRFVPVKESLQKRGGDGIIKNLTSIRLHIFIDSVE